MYLFLKWEEGLEGGEIIQGRERGGILVPRLLLLSGGFFPPCKCWARQEAAAPHTAAIHGGHARAGRRIICSRYSPGKMGWLSERGRSVMYRSASLNTPIY